MTRASYMVLLFLLASPRPAAAEARGAPELRFEQWSLGGLAPTVPLASPDYQLERSGGPVDLECAVTAPTVADGQQGRPGLSHHGCDGDLVAAAGEPVRWPTDVPAARGGQAAESVVLARDRGRPG